MEWTDGYKMVEIKVGDKTYNGFYKVTRKGVITVESKIDIPVKPYDHIIIGVDKVVVQNITILNGRSEITCESVNTTDIVKSNKTLKKFKKYEIAKGKDTDGESI
jgi:hypothetical protein